MNFSPRWLWLLAAFALLALCHRGHPPILHLPGELVTEVPLQEPLDSAPSELRKGDITIKPLAKFSLSARVLSRADYRWDTSAQISPTDLALGWQRMSDSSILAQMEISQSGRFYYWQAKEYPIPPREIIESSANMHLIPADPAVAREISKTRIGDVVSFDGYLVQANWPDGGKWTSSLTRSDSGNGACELIWVEHFGIAPR